jgi:hypothetical protein
MEPIPEVEAAEEEGIVMGSAKTEGHDDSPIYLYRLLWAVAVLVVTLCAIGIVSLIGYYHSGAGAVSPVELERMKQQREQAVREGELQRMKNRQLEMEQRGKAFKGP